PPGTPGSIVVTDLSNFAMPLVRYLIGDVGVLSSKRCVCGRGSVRLEAIEGREADYVVTAAGELISGISLTENFAVLVPGVAQIQIVQEEVQRFLFRIVRAADFTAASERALGGLVAERFGHGTDHRFRLVRQRHAGQPRTKNRGLAEARAPFVAFLDADDVWAPTKLARQVELFRSDAALGVVATRRILVDADGKPRAADLRRWPRGRVVDAMFRQNFVCFSS